MLCTFLVVMPFWTLEGVTTSCLTFKEVSDLPENVLTLGPGLSGFWAFYNFSWGPILDTCSIQVQALYFSMGTPFLLPFACYIIDHLKQGIQQSVKIIKMFVFTSFQLLLWKSTIFLLSRRSFPRFCRTLVR